jgi:hypothetical protein
MMKNIFDSDSNIIVDTKQLLDSFNTIKMVLTLKETDELVDSILNDTRRKLDSDTNNICIELRRMLEECYKPLD